TLKRNLDLLLAADYRLSYSSRERENRYGEETVATDWYAERDFDDSELRLLIDSVLFSLNIPTRQRRDLIEKLRNLSSVHFQKRTRHLQCTGSTNNKTANKQLFHTIDVLDEAIEQKRRIAYCYGHYDIDKELHPNLDTSGQPLVYEADPYQLVATNGGYYLLCHNNQQEGIIHHRIDRMLNVEMLSIKRLPLSKVTGQANAVDMGKYLSEHPYMFHGELMRIRFRALRRELNQIFDEFGGNVELSNVTDENVDVTVHANAGAMLRWALQFGDLIEVLEPESLRQALAREHATGLEKYAASRIVGSNK
ncbi:MAG: WYL domain-containing protein, partial [Coriobacteriales bacterium]|nr:WYL domain-containing protein [Coriobacteriales bacterium]